MKTDTKQLNQKLLRACENNNCEEIIALINQGANINCGDEEKNRAPIYIAALNGHFEAIQTLAGLGADVNKANNDGATPVYVAAQKGHFEAIKTLKELGADVNIVTNDGATPVSAAAFNGHVEAIKTLAGLGADVNKANNNGATPVYVAAYNGHVEAIKTLKELGADVNIANKDGITPVYAAAENGQAEAIKTLKELGADVNIVTNDGATPVHAAAYNGHVEAIKTLKELGADVNIANKNGSTPIYIAASKDYVEAIQTLAGLGADINIAMNDGATPVYIAAENGHVEAIKTLKELGADVNKANSNGATPVFVAALNGHVEAIKTLAGLGADVNKANNNGATPVYAAAQNGHVEAIQALAGLGADVNKANNDGTTPLFIASQQGKSRAIKTLKELGADVNKANNNGATPVYVAAENGHVEAIQTLAGLGADVNIANKNGTTPIEIATMQNKTVAMEALFYLGADTQRLTNPTSDLNVRRLVNADKLIPSTLDLIKQFTNPQLIALRDKQLTASNICKQQKEFYDGWEKSRSDYQESLLLKARSSSEETIFTDSNIKNYYENLREELTNNLLFLKFTLFAVQHFFSSVLNRQEIISTALAYAIDKDKTGLTTYPLADVLKSADPEIIRKLNSVSCQDSKDLIKLADNLALEMTIQKIKEEKDIVNSKSSEIHQKIINTAVDLQEESQSQIQKLSKFEHRSKASQQFDSFKSAEPPLAYQPLIKIEESSDQQVELHLRKMAIFDAKNIWDNLSKKGIEEYSPTTTKSKIASNIIAQIVVEQRLPSTRPKTTGEGLRRNPGRLDDIDHSLTTP